MTRDSSGIDDFFEETSQVNFSTSQTRVEILSSSALLYDMFEAFFVAGTWSLAQATCRWLSMRGALIGTSIYSTARIHLVLMIGMNS